jgi:hypothetical protein
MLLDDTNVRLLGELHANPRITMSALGRDCFLVKVPAASVPDLEEPLDQFLTYGQTVSSIVVSTPCRRDPCHCRAKMCRTGPRRQPNARPPILLSRLRTTSTAARNILICVPPVRRGGRKEPAPERLRARPAGHHAPW